MRLRTVVWSLLCYNGKVMNKKVLHVLEYFKIIERLSAEATGESGRRRCEALRPSDDKDEIEKRLEHTEDAFNRIVKLGKPSFSQNNDPKEYERRLSVDGAALSAGELLDIAGLLRNVDEALKYGRFGKDEIQDSLTGYFDELGSLGDIRKEITRCILSEDEIADDASPRLKEIRRALRGGNDRIRSRMNEILNSSVRDCLMEPVITLRQGRFCLPVKAEYKSKVAGIVHDQSGSGATLFIEPMSVVELGNSLREQELFEKEEIARILLSLSEAVSNNMPVIMADHEILTELDFIFACASLALKENAVRPVVGTDGIVSLRGARHPLLEPSDVVPIDITLGDDYTLLIVTGPNTGGKTVSLKTVGLLTLMGQSGLFIPALDRSRISIFTEVYADIGDEQSIEQSLSTFSSHMMNIIQTLKHIRGSDYLVLLDELCAGTDPIEGAALATAILDRIKSTGARCMATTHYSELKSYALTENGAENACCEFDVATLSPTYRLMIGVPGKSNAFAISEKLGLPKALVEDAKGRISEEQRSMEELMRELEEKRSLIEKDRAFIDAEKEKLRKEKSTVDEKSRKLKEQRERILREANEKASNILSDAKQTADAAIRKVNKYGSADADIVALEKTRGNLGKKIKHTKEAATKNERQDTRHKALRPEDVRIGDRVRVLSMGISGTVHTLPDKKGELVVLMGIMQSKVKLNDLELLPEEDVSKTVSKASHRSFSKAASISPEIQLLGMTTDEAIAVLDKYLDDAYISHLESVRVVHGKGTGALRSAVSQFLRKHPHVEEYHQGEYGEGDAGVTIVTFK